MMRSALTMLGVFIGVAALIAMVAVGQGANEAVRKQIESLGTNLRRGAAGRQHDGRHARRLRQRLDADGRRRAGDPPREHGGQRGQLSDPPVRARSQYGNQNWTTSIQGVSANYPPITNWRIAAGRAISADDEARAALVVVIGQTVVTPAVRRIGKPDRRAHPGEGRAVARDRRARVQGPDVVRPGSGRPRHDPVHHRRAQGARRGRAVAGADAAQLDLSERRPTPTACAAPDRLRQPDLRAGRQSDGRAAGDPPDHRDPRAPPSHQARRRQRFLRAQSEPDRRDRRELAAASWRCCSPPSPRSRWWSAASAS